MSSGTTTESASSTKTDVARKLHFVLQGKGLLKPSYAHSGLSRSLARVKHCHRHLAVLDVSMAASRRLGVL
jgi:hypothetical protein